MTPGNVVDHRGDIECPTHDVICKALQITGGISVEHALSRYIQSPCDELYRSV